MNWNNLSTPENPIGFFEYFLDSGLREFSNSFFGNNANIHRNADLFSDEVATNNIIENKVGILTITKEESDAGGTGEYILFSEELNAFLNKQKEQSINLIDSRVLNAQDNPQAKHFIETLIIRLEKLHVKSGEIGFQNHPEIRSSIEYLYRVAKEGNSHLFNSAETDKTVEVNAIEVSLNDIEKDRLTFNVKPEYSQSLKFLYQALSENDFIDNSTSLETFISAFTGKSFPDNKRIKWKIKGLNKDFSKQSIIHFIQQLIDKGVILPISNTLIKRKIVEVFENDKGEKIENIQVSFASMKKRKRITKSEIIINEIISKMKT